MQARRRSKLMLGRLITPLLVLLLEGGSSFVVQPQQHRANVMIDGRPTSHQHSTSSGAGTASIKSVLPSAQPRTTRARRCIAAYSSISKSDLESTFYSFDADSSGEIDLEELKEALANLGLVASDEQVLALLNKYDADGGGTIDLEEFQRLVTDDALAAADLPQEQITYAMDLFRRFDADNSGTIDKAEFLAIASKMKRDSTRRELVSVAAAAYGAFLVSEQSFEFQFLQKKLRSNYVDKAAEDSQNFYFPTALLSGDFDKAVARALDSRGFTPANTLFAHSVCSDEVNNRKEQVIPLMVNRWREGFSLGGLGGLPFAGKSGFGAYLHHVPDNGKLLILFAPHVGIEKDGRVGVLQRDGQSSISTACGAAVGAYKALQEKKKSTPDPLVVVEALKKEDTDLFDPQIEKIVSLLAPRLEGIEDSASSIAFVTYQMYAIIRELLEGCIDQTADLHDYASEVAVVGGIMINRRKGGDFFQPLSFDVCRKGEVPMDVFEEAFGARPDLVPILGSESAVSRLYGSRALEQGFLG